MKLEPGQCYQRDRIIAGDCLLFRVNESGPGRGAGLVFNGKHVIFKFSIAILQCGCVTGRGVVDNLMVPRLPLCMLEEAVN